jgi:N-acylneuraminate cytidylyltransferase
MNIAFVPIRKGSKGIKNKNRKILNNKPLFHYSLITLLNVKLIDKVILATNDDELISTFDYSSFKNSNKLTIYRRLEKNAKDESTTESVMLEFIKQSNLKLNDNFLLVQATSPLTTSDDINKSLETFLRSNYDSMLSVVRSTGFYWGSNGLSLNYDWRNRPRRQDIKDETYLENGAFYISKVKNIIDNQNRISGNIGFYIMKDYQKLDIDDIEDFYKAEKLLSSLKNN